jgi:hypothetical protein
VHRRLSDEVLRVLQRVSGSPRRSSPGRSSFSYWRNLITAVGNRLTTVVGTGTISALTDSAVAERTTRLGARSLAVAVLRRGSTGATVAVTIALLGGNGALAISSAITSAEASLGARASVSAVGKAVKLNLLSGVIDVKVSSGN